MKTLVALGVAGLLLSVGVLTGGTAFAREPWPHTGESWQHSTGSWQPHPSQTWSHPSGSWSHSSGSWPHPNSGPYTHSSESWIHDHDHHEDHHHRRRWGGTPFFGWGPGPGYYNDYDYGYDDGYYPPVLPYDYGAHVRWCKEHYRTYNPATDTFFIRRNVPARCIAPFDRP